MGCHNLGNDWLMKNFLEGGWNRDSLEGNLCPRCLKNTLWKQRSILYLILVSEVGIHRLGGSYVNLKLNNYFIGYLHQLDGLSHSVARQAVLCCFWHRRACLQKSSWNVSTQNIMGSNSCEQQGWMISCTDILSLFSYVSAYNLEADEDFTESYRGSWKQDWKR